MAAVTASTARRSARGGWPRVAPRRLVAAGHALAPPRRFGGERQIWRKATSFSLQVRRSEDSASMNVARRLEIITV